ncbi:uncharacterized protein LOC143357640 [Halictus rubicundus]|uniref:uncharacterized protein LOC143357640 n=1 Tax=Halictus rubicundus TaxID=77578 RepID=UPI00403620E9
MRVMFVIVMDRSVIICSIFLALIATSSCKSIGRNDENAAASASIKPDPIDSAIVPESSTENHTPKSDPATFPSPNDETRIRRSEDPDCSSRRNQKTKRCKSLLQKDPRPELLSLKTPNSALNPDPAEDHRFALIRSLREKLKKKGYNLGATLKRSLGRTRIVEDDDYVCYCQEKNNRNNRKLLPSESRLQQRPLYLHQPYLSDGLHGHLPNLLPENVNPTLQNLLLYPPYLYHVDPSSLLPSQGQSPTGINVPSSSIADKHDSIVGQQTPGTRNQQSVGQRCPPNNSANRPRIPAVSSKPAKANGEPSGQRKPAEDANYNLQSVKNSPKNTGNVAKDNSNLVGAAEPSNDPRTGSGTKDYSNVEEEIHSTTEVYGGHLGDDGYGLYTTSGSVEETTDLESSLDGSTEDPSEDDLAGNKNIVLGNSNPSLPSIDDLNKNDSVSRDNATLGQSNPLPQEETSTEDLEEDPGKMQASKENDKLGQGNPLPREEPLIDAVNKNPGNSDPSKDNSANDGNVALGKSNPWPQEPSIDALNKNPVNSDPLNDSTDALNINPQVPMANEELNDGPESSSADPALMSDTGDINHSVTPEGFFTDYSEDPLNIDQDDLNLDKVDARIGDAKDQEGLGNGSSMNADVTPSSRGNEDLVNGRETVGAGNPAGIPKQALPFCDNSLLEKSIKTVINNFAAENDGDTGQDMLGSARDDLLKEIVDVPNLKGILSLPPVERTVLDKVKNMLVTMTGLPRSKFDGEWPTSVIRNNLRHSLAAAPSANTELPPNTVQERQFKNGKWVSSFVTLEPMLKNEDENSGDDERVRASVKSLLNDPAVSLEAAKHPVVQNMIVQSVHNTFQNSSSDLIQSILDNELNLMGLEDVETTTADENTGQTQANDLDDIDMNELLEIARNVSGVTESGSTSTQDGLLESVTDGYKDSEIGSALNTQQDAQTELPGDLADQEGASLDQKEEGMREKSKIPTGPKLPEYDAVPTIVSSMTESPSNLVGATNDPRIIKYPGPSSTSSATQQLSPKTGSPVVGQSIENLEERKQESVTENPSEISPDRRNSDKSSGPEEDLESVLPTTPFTVGKEEVVGMRRSEETTPDYTYMGKISVKKNNYSDDIDSLQNCELFYIGDGVKLPLEIRRLSDGSYALSISRKVCEHLLNEDCPCCVPAEGNVLRKVRREPSDEEEAVGKKNISKRASISAGSVDSDHPGSADDSLQISMPVETFARRYNLSLNLQKLQAPWKFDKKTDDREKNGATNFGNRDSGNANLRSLLAVHGVAENGKSEGMGVDDSYERSDDVNGRYRRQKHRKHDKDRYERNVDEKVNKRVEIVTDVLYWLRDMILSARA